MPRVERRDHVDEVIRVPVADQHAPDVPDRNLLLEPGEGPGPGVHPQMEPVVRDEVAAALAPRTRPRPLRPQDGELHAGVLAPRCAAVTCASSPPRNVSARSRNGATSPVVRNSWCADPVAGHRRSARSSSAYTSFAVSSAEETSATSGPSPIWSSPESSG